MRLDDVDLDPSSYVKFTKKEVEYLDQRILTDLEEEIIVDPMLINHIKEEYSGREKKIGE